MTIIRVDVRADETNALLLELQRRTGDIRPAMEGIAQILVSNTQLRFVDQNDPAGNPWEPLSELLCRGGAAEVTARKSCGTPAG